METQGKGGALAAKAVVTPGKGGVLATKAVKGQGKGTVLPCVPSEIAWPFCAYPKSATLMLPSASTKMFSGLMSRWQTF